MDLVRGVSAVVGVKQANRYPKPPTWSIEKPLGRLADHVTFKDFLGSLVIFCLDFFLVVSIFLVLRLVLKCKHYHQFND